MKYIKKYEEKSDKPKIGDYVKVNHNKFCVISKEIFKNNIGILVEIIQREVDLQLGGYPYIVEFDDNVPVTGTSMDDNKISLSLAEIEAFASTKEELDIKLNAKKYNL